MSDVISHKMLKTCNENPSSKYPYKYQEIARQPRCRPNIHTAHRPLPHGTRVPLCHRRTAPSSELAATPAAMLQLGADDARLTALLRSRRAPLALHARRPTDAARIRHTTGPA